MTSPFFGGEHRRTSTKNDDEQTGLAELIDIPLVQLINLLLPAIRLGRYLGVSDKSWGYPKWIVFKWKILSKWMI